MKNLMRIILLVVMSTSAAVAKGKVKSGIEKKRLESMGAKLGTDFRMNGLSVGGRYQSAGVGLATVENDKPIFDLLDYDHDFKGRSLESRSWK